MQRVIRPDYAAPMGDIRALGLGDVVVVYPGSEQRKDWGRLVDATAAAVSRGAEVLRGAE